MSAAQQSTRQSTLAQEQPLHTPAAPNMSASRVTEQGRTRKLTGMSDGTLANELRRSPLCQGMLTKLNKDAKKWSVSPRCEQSPASASHG